MTTEKGKVKDCSQVLKGLTRELKGTPIFPWIEHDIIRNQDVKFDPESYFYRNPIKDYGFCISKGAEFNFRTDAKLSSCDEYNAIFKLNMAGYIQSFLSKKNVWEYVKFEDGKELNFNEISLMTLYGWIVSSIGISATIILIYIVFGLIATIVVSFIIVLLLTFVVNGLKLRQDKDGFY